MDKELYGFWHYDTFPYCCSGTITDMNDKGNIETKEFGYGTYYHPIKILPKSIGLELKVKLEAIENEYNEAKKKLEEEYDGKLGLIAPFIFDKETK